MAAPFSKNDRQNSSWGTLFMEGAPRVAFCALKKCVILSQFSNWRKNPLNRRNSLTTLCWQRSEKPGDSHASDIGHWLRMTRTFSPYDPDAQDAFNLFQVLCHHVRRLVIQIRHGHGVLAPALVHQARIKNN